MITIPEIKVETTQMPDGSTRVRAFALDCRSGARKVVQTHVPGASLLQSRHNLLRDVQAQAVADLARFFLDQQA